MDKLQKQLKENWEKMEENLPKMQSQPIDDYNKLKELLISDKEAAIQLAQKMAADAHKEMSNEASRILKERE